MGDNRRDDRRDDRRVSAKAWAEKQGGGWEPTAIKKPSGMENFKLDKEGILTFDVMPFIAGKGNPYADAGFPYFMRSYEVHKIPRPDGSGSDWYCCLWSCWREKCPMCTARKNAKSEAEADALKSQARMLFLVNDKPGKLKNPIKLLDEVQYNRGLGFGQQLAVAMNATRGGHEFANLAGGLTVQVTVSHAKYRQVGRIDLLPRAYDYPNDMLDKMPCLDEFLIKPDVKTIEALLEQFGAAPVDGGSDPSDDAPRRVPVTDPSDANRGRGGDDAPLRAAVAPRVDEDDDDEDDAPPVRAAVAKPVTKIDEDDDDEDDAPPAVSRVAAPASKKSVDKKKDDDDDPPEPARSASKKEPTAKDLGLKEGQCGRFKGMEVTIVKISGDGTALKLKDGDGEIYTAVAPEKFKPIKEEAPTKEKPKSRPADDDDDFDDDDDD